MQSGLQYLTLGMADQGRTKDVLMPAILFIEMLKGLFADFPIRIVQQLIHNRLI